MIHTADAAVVHSHELRANCSQPSAPKAMGRRQRADGEKDKRRGNGEVHISS
jgi:hypothetical protein